MAVHVVWTVGPVANGAELAIQLAGAVLVATFAAGIAKCLSGVQLAETRLTSNARCGRVAVSILASRGTDEALCSSAARKITVSTLLAGCGRVGVMVVPAS